MSAFWNGNAVVENLESEVCDCATNSSMLVCSMFEEYEWRQVVDCGDDECVI